MKQDKPVNETLPILPRKDQEGDQPGELELIARLFDAPHKASAALDFVNDLQRRQPKKFRIYNSALLIKDAEGKVTITETGDPSAKNGTIPGAVAVGLLSALAGPIGILVAAAAGAGLGRVRKRWIDLGLPDDFLLWLQIHFQADHSALILLIEHEYLQALAEATTGMEGMVRQYSLPETVVRQLLEERPIQS